MKKDRELTLPIYIELGSDGYYFVECPVFQGCYTQGKTFKEALENIQEVIDLVLEEPEDRDFAQEFGVAV